MPNVMKELRFSDSYNNYAVDYIITNARIRVKKAQLLKSERNNGINKVNCSSALKKQIFHVCDVFMLAYSIPLL